MGQAGADFGGLLKTMREGRRVSQSKLAERADFDHSYVSRLESGARMPTRDAVERLATALSLSQTEEDGLLAAAGFLPRDVSSLLSGEPVLGEVLDLLQNDAVPMEYRENIRQVLRLLTEQAQFAMRRENGAGLAGVAA
jgi:transcriptional regulator with XRE-family HTH domain